MIKINNPNCAETKSVWMFLRVLAIKGYFLTPESKILDFGCKKGELVVLLRKMGFNAYGFDIHDFSESIEPEYRKYFFTIGSLNKDKSRYSVDWNKYRLPFNDNEFDFIYSRSVFEHIGDHDKVLSEINRVLKTPGVSIHKYQPRYAIMDTHSRVPFGGLFKNRYYFLFWALCGLRNKRQAGKPVMEVVNINLNTAIYNLNYVAPKNILRMAKKYFPSAKFIPQHWNFDNPLLKYCLKSRSIHNLYNNICKSILLLEK